MVDQLLPKGVEGTNGLLLQHVLMAEERGVHCCDDNPDEEQNELQLQLQLLPLLWSKFWLVQLQVDAAPEWKQQLLHESNENKVQSKILTHYTQCAALAQMEQRDYHQLMKLLRNDNHWRSHHLLSYLQLKVLSLHLAVNDDLEQLNDDGDGGGDEQVEEPVEFEAAAVAVEEVLSSYAADPNHQHRTIKAVELQHVVVGSAARMVQPSVGFQARMFGQHSNKDVMTYFYNTAGFAGVIGTIDYLNQVTRRFTGNCHMDRVSANPEQETPHSEDDELQLLT
ncbi:hypothetical protein C0J52_24771 [Blattella germanica]|nr:hypothetical protein C0J52_24771 [Blattella germanica]